MKKMFTYTFVIVMAALVFYGGTGVNMVSFCCSDCRTAGMEVLTGDKCCEIHGHTHDQIVIESASASVGHSHEMCCDLERVNFDWDSEQVSIENPEPITFELFLTGLPDISIINLPFVGENTSVMPTGPPLLPRTYLSLLTTLLI